METEALRWVLLIAGILMIVGIYGYSRELKKEKDEKKIYTRQDDLFDDLPEVDPLLDDVAEVAEKEAPRVEPLVDVRPQEIERSIVFHLFAQEDQAFSGKELFAAFDELNLKRTTNHFFVLVEHDQVYYHVCSSFKPSFFPEKDKENFTTKGLTFFMTLPIQNPKQVFEKMLLDLHKISLKLEGKILDEDRNGLTAQMMNHLREELINYSHNTQRKES